MDSIRNEEHNWKQNYAWFTIQREREREREIWRQSLIENPVVLAIPPGSIVRDANYVVSSDAAYLWRGIKTGGPTGGGTGHPLQPDVGMSPSRAFTRNFYFPCEKKKKTRRRKTGVEEKRERETRRRVGCLGKGVGKKGGGRKRRDKNNGLEREEKEDGIERDCGTKNRE